MTALKVAGYQKTQDQKENEIQTERFGESSCKKHCKTALLVEKDLAAFLGCHVGSLNGKYYHLGC